MSDPTEATEFMVPDPEVPRLKIVMKGDTTLRDYAKLLTAMAGLWDAVATEMGIPEADLRMVMETPSIDYQAAPKEDER